VNFQNLNFELLTLNQSSTYRYFLNLSYNGDNYHGWQIQPNAVTVQETLNNSLSLLFQEEINVVGCGRTDAGVHAEMFFAHFDLEKAPEPVSLSTFLHKLNGMLPADIVIKDFFPVKSDVHARFDAVSRTYRYQVLRKKDAFLFGKAYPYYLSDLNTDLMNRGAEMLLNHSDFTSFSKLHTDVKTNNCKIIHAGWEYHDPLLVFTITADRFLRNMVRAIVGTLLDLGRGKINLQEFEHIIESRDRSEAGFSVPAKGLFLAEVKYPDNIRIKIR